MGKEIELTLTTIRRHQVATPSVATNRYPRWLGVGAILLGLGVAAIALIGPLAGDVVRYHVSEEATNQVIGGDAVAMVLVAPIGVIAGILTLRGIVAGPMLALGAAVYAMYTYTQLVVGGDVVRYQGNSERFFPLFVALFVLAGSVAIGAWSRIEAAQLPATSPRMDRIVGIGLVTVAAFLVLGLHLPTLVDAWSHQSTGPEYLADPNVFWVVKLMDLGLVVPGMAAIAIGVLRGSGWAGKAKYAAIGWFALLGSSVAGMALVMQVRGDPAASTGNTVAFGTFAVVGLAIAATVYAPLLRMKTTDAQPTSAA